MASNRESSKIALIVTVLVMLTGIVFFAWQGRRISRRGRPRAAPRKPDEVTVREESVTVLTPKDRTIPGETVSAFLTYRHPAATNVLLSGSWDQWGTNRPMSRKDGLWQFDVSALGLPLGRYEFKFIPDGEWETGANRPLFVNEDGLVERPPDVMLTARLETPTRIDVLFKREFPHPDSLEVRLVPDVPIRDVRWVRGNRDSRRMGYSVAGEFVTFIFDERIYGVSLSKSDRVGVAGTFNNWYPDGASGSWLLNDADGDGVWNLTVRLGAELSMPKPHEFKFVINSTRWLIPPLTALNATGDGKGNVNLRLDPTLSSTELLQVHTEKPLDLAQSYLLILGKVDGRLAYRPVTPGQALDEIASSKRLGAILDPVKRKTTYRLYAPRATVVELLLYDGPLYASLSPEGPDPVPRETVRMKQDTTDGVWEAVMAGLHSGGYYAFRVDGSEGQGEGFNARAPLGDPYARAAASDAGNTIVLDPAASNEWFSGWTDGDFQAPAWEDAVIYETHVRDLTIMPSSGVPEPLRGTYEGILASQGTGTGLDHLKALGVNVIEFMPICEFNAGTNAHSWGYSTVYFFAPESQYARAPLKGSQYYEFKRLVNELHRQGFAVVLDVVYNHVGHPNIFERIDRKYYFRMDADYALSNFSGCGNDVRSEAPMMRRLIIDNVLYWMREHHVDGFRFDLAELIDLETLMALRDAARAENPDVLLISEPWSFRGDHKYRLTGTGWSAWNNEFRDTVRHFIRGGGNREDLKKAIRGSVDTWAADPLQSVNYLASHDDMCLADELSSDPRRDGRNLKREDVARNRLGATILFTSVGIPMLSEGQEYIRSKRGLHNTFTAGDAVNGLEWKDRERPMAKEALLYYRDLIRLRSSKAGASFRVSGALPDGHFEWIEPHENRAIGYVVNGGRQGGSSSAVVLVNAANEAVTFAVPFPSGTWRLIGNGEKINVRGIEGVTIPPPVDGVRQVTVPALASYIFVAVE